MLPHRAVGVREQLAEVRAGARVECRDGTLGIVQRVERDESGLPQHLRVREEGTARSVIVPLGLMREIGDDGTVWLGTTIDEAKTFTPRAASDQPTQRTKRAGPAPALTVPLHHEELGAVVIRTQVDHVPGHVEVDAKREEIELEHVPVDEVVQERVEPWYQEGDLVIPVYEERLVVAKELVLKERLRVRRLSVLERHTFEEMLRRERIVAEDPDRTGALCEIEGDRVAEAIRGLARNVVAKIRGDDGRGKPT